MTKSSYAPCHSSYSFLIRNFVSVRKLQLWLGLTGLKQIPIAACNDSFQMLDPALEAI